MGTSQSSNGPGPRVPMVPPWTPPPPKENPPEPPPPPPEDDPEEGDDSDAVPEQAVSVIAQPLATPPPVIPLAPNGRFREARANLGRFANGGDADDLAKGLGHYVRKGYGGAATASQRFGGTAATAATFGQILANLTSDATAASAGLDRQLLSSRTANEVMDAVVEAVRPVDGTQDAEAERAAMHDALAELLAKYPNADLLDLDAAQREFAIEQFAAIDVFRRFELDVGKAIIEKAPTATAALARLKEARDYIREAISASFRQLRDAGHRLTTAPIAQVVRDALRQTLQVFEGYAE